MDNHNRMHAIEFNLISFYLSHKGLLHPSYFEDDHLQTIRCHTTWPKAIFSKSTAADHLSLMLHTAQSISVEDAFWILSDEFVKNNKHLMRAAGLIPYRAWTCMYLHQNKRLQHAEALSHDGQIHIVDSNESMTEFVGLVNSVFYQKDILNLDEYLAMLTDDRYRFFLWRVQDKAIGTGLLYTDEGHTGIYYISILPEYRNQGHALQLVTQMLDIGVTQGLHDFVLHATPMATKLYENLGFENYGKLNIFVKMKNR